MANDRAIKRATGCSGKIIYPSWARAAKVAKARNRNQDGRLGPYRCHFCGGVHLGNHSPIEMNRFNESNRPDARRDRRRSRALVRAGSEIDV